MDLRLSSFAGRREVSLLMPHIDRLEAPTPADRAAIVDVFALIPDILSRRKAYMLRSAAIGRALGIPRLLMPNPSKG
jgi:hypothetical protein